MEDVTTNSFFIDEGISNTHQKPNTIKSKDTIEQKRWLILKWIGENPNQTCYGIAKGTETAYSQMHQILREMLFSRLICPVKVTGENGELYTGYYLPEIKEEKKEEDGD